ncbi:unnamed protein product, partial [Ascophyllum nodosum]
MQRRGQTGAGFWGVLGKVKSLPEAKARAIADFFAAETENHDLGLLVAEVKTSLTRQGLRFGAPSEVEGEGHTAPSTPITPASPTPITPAEEAAVGGHVTLRPASEHELVEAFSEMAFFLQRATRVPDTLYNAGIIVTMVAVSAEPRGKDFFALKKAWAHSGRPRRCTATVQKWAFEFSRR